MSSQNQNQIAKTTEQTILTNMCDQIDLRKKQLMDVSQWASLPVL